MYTKTGHSTVRAVIIALTWSGILVHACASASSPAVTFGEDLTFLRQHTSVILLSNEQGTGQVAIAPSWQGRVMTSTAQGKAGRSFGWINRSLIASGNRLPHINAFGGEDRLWLGPEGGQFSIFFAKDAPFDIEHWYVPPPLDTLPFKTISHARDRARFQARFTLTNYSGTLFNVHVDREVRLLSHIAAWRALSLAPAKDVALVAYESNNTLHNVGTTPWNRQTGLLSIWILGMFAPSPSVTIVAPIRPGPDSELGPKVNSDYFGSIPRERLAVTERAIFFSGDGLFRSKIGLTPRRSLGKLGSYDAEHQVLTLVQFTQPEGVTEYVNSLWKLQDDPFAGDAANSYNDGPLSPGGPALGPFYELESSSPAAALKAGGSLRHSHRTFHLTGSEAALDRVARTVLGVSLSEIRAALPHHE